ncbi:MAG: hypothetical protein ACSHXF_10760 [Aquaticitalea sp.]
MDNLTQKLKDLKSSFLPTDKKTILTGTLIAIFLGTSPYLFYLYEYAPKKEVWETPLFTYHSFGFKDVNTALWLITGKAIPTILLIVWFFTCRQWWYHAILVPIAMYIYQLVAIIIEDGQFVDQFQLMYILPIMAVVIPSIYLIRARMFNSLNDANKTFEELEQEFMVKPTTFWGKIKQYF